MPVCRLPSWSILDDTLWNLCWQYPQAYCPLFSWTSITWHFSEPIDANSLLQSRHGFRSPCFLMPVCRFPSWSILDDSLWNLFVQNPQPYFPLFSCTSITWHFSEPLVVNFLSQWRHISRFPFWLLFFSLHFLQLHHGNS